MKYKIGIVGLGIMGGGIASNFLKKGYSIFVWNRTKSVTDAYVKKGATACLTPSDVAQKADIIFEVTANDKSSKKVWLGKRGILSGANTKKILLASATLSVGWVDKIIAKCNDSKFTFFDMALTGGRIGAESGNLTLLCGGNEAKLEKLKPTLKAISSKMLYFGPEGKGMRYKLILNFIQATHIVAFGQAMKIAKAYGMNIKTVGDALAERPGGVITSLAWRDYQVEPNPINFSIDWITKDLTYAKEMVKDLDVKLLNQVFSEYKKAVRNGFGKKDWASINTLKP